MKIKETTPNGSVRVDVVPEWSTDEDRPAKGHGKEEMVSSRDTSSDTSIDLGDKVNTPWILWSVATLEKYEAQNSGVLIRREDGTQSSSLLIGESDFSQDGSAHIGLEDEAWIGSVRIGPEEVAHICDVQLGQEGRT
jgi:hypothetical protein